MTEMWAMVVLWELFIFSIKSMGPVYTLTFNSTKQERSCWKGALFTREHERAPLWFFCLRGFSTSPRKSKPHWCQYHTLPWMVWSTSLPSFPPVSSQLIKLSDSLWRRHISSMMYEQSRKQWSLFKFDFYLFRNSNPTRIF